MKIPQVVERLKIVFIPTIIGSAIASIFSSLLLLWFARGAENSTEGFSVVAMGFIISMLVLIINLFVLILVIAMVMISVEMDIKKSLKSKLLYIALSSVLYIALASIFIVKFSIFLKNF